MCAVNRTCFWVRLDIELCDANAHALSVWLWHGTTCSVLLYASAEDNYEHKTV